MATRKDRIGGSRVRAAALLCAVQFAASPALGQDPAYGVPVTAGGIRDIIVRHHFTHRLPDGPEYVLTYGPDGTTELVLRSGARFAGTWTLDSTGRLCLSWPAHSGPDCFSVFLDGDLLRLVDRSGRIAGETRLPGDPPSWLAGVN